MPKLVNGRNGLAALRKSKGLRASYVSQALGINIGTLGKWEAEGREPSTLGYFALSSFYEMPIVNLKHAARQKAGA